MSGRALNPNIRLDKISCSCLEKKNRWTSDQAFENEKCGKGDKWRAGNSST
jgi:hypothetical protein